MKAALEHLVYTSLINDYGVQAWSAGIKKSWFTEAQRHCIYKHDRALSLMEPRDWEKLPLVFRFYSIPSEEDGAPFFISRTYIGGADRSGRIVTITHSVQVPDELLREHHITPLDLMDRIQWLKSYKGKPQSVLPPLEVDLSEGNDPTSFDALLKPESSLQASVLFHVVMKAFDHGKSLFIFPTNPEDYDLCRQSLRLIFLLLPHRELSFSLKEFYAPQVNYRLVLFDPRSSMENASDGKAVRIPFPIPQREIQIGLNPAIEHFVSRIWQGDMKALFEIREQMRKVPELKLNSRNLLTRFQFWQYVVSPVRNGSVIDYPKALPAWIEYSDSLLSDSNDEFSRKYLLDFMENGVAPVPKDFPKPDLALKLCSRWGRLLEGGSNVPFQGFMTD